MSEQPTTSERPLTWKQKQFCYHYSKHFNGTLAYKEAGFQAKNDNVAGVQAHRLLRDPRVQAEIAKAVEEQKLEDKLSRENVLSHYKAIRDNCTQRIPVIRNGEMVHNEKGDIAYRNMDAKSAIAANTKIAEILHLMPTAKTEINVGVNVDTQQKGLTRDDLRKMPAELRHQLLEMMEQKTKSLPPPESENEFRIEDADYEFRTDEVGNTNFVSSEITPSQGEISPTGRNGTSDHS